MNRKRLLKRVLFGGYYGMDNVGDNSFGSILTWGARNYWGTEKTFLLSKKEIEGPIKTYPCLMENQFFRGQMICESFWQVLRSTCVVWGGGSIFHSKVPLYTPRHFSFFTSKVGITPTGAIGVSLGPYKTWADQRAVHTYLSHLHFLTLRDKASYEEARSINLPYKPILAADLAMLLPKMVPDFKAANHDCNILGITVCHYERYVNKDKGNETRREKILLDALVNLVQNGYTGTFRFFIFNSNLINGDKVVTMEFYNKLKDRGARVELVSYSINPIAIWIKVAECTAMISTRLHGTIFAAAANVPCCLIEYHRKCTAFITDAGVADKWIIGDVSCTSKVLSEKLLELLTSSHINFYPLREYLIKMAERNFTFLYE
jgi:polysaccharide pyruvyl transferase WcaK-like protein